MEQVAGQDVAGQAAAGEVVAAVDAASDPAGDPPSLAALRGSLDDTDARIVQLIARRFALVEGIGAAKASEGRVLRDPARESRVLEAVEREARAAGVSADLVRRIFTEIMSQAVVHQAAAITGSGTGTVRVAYQGVANAYSYLAAGKYLAGAGLTGELLGQRTFSDTVTALLAGDVDLAFLPIENTTAGSINEVYDLLREREVYVVGEETWKVDHCLAGPEEVPVSSLRRILSHAQGLEQCGRFLASLPSCQPVPVFDTAEAMRLVAEAGDPSQAAIGSPEAAAAAGLVVLRRGIANQVDNFTRFVVVAREPAAVDPRIPCKTSLVLVTRHEEGALLRCLEVLAATGHSMTKLESRPRPGRPWEYLFFLDFEGNVGEARTAGALDELRTTAQFLKVLGSYPAKALREEPRPGEVTGPTQRPEADSYEAVAAAPAKGRAKSSHYRLVDRAARTEDTVIRVGRLLVGGDGFTVMAGPCSVESPEQILATARFVRDQGAHVLRGGVFKPRTSPYAFQGLGWDGLDALVSAGRETGMPVVTEVMAVEQVARVAKAADILQIGARNMQNFDLLREVGRVDRPVLLKRGLSSTVEEWLAAAEYVVAEGNQQVILCERGIRTFESATRNTLDLSAVVVARERSHLPVIVDPSHGTGHRAYVAPMAWAARAVGAHGLLIEVHPDPDAALSDAEQSLGFLEFAALMDGLAAVPGPPRLGVAPGL
jgi:chorismate mutase/prephenate dehydratase